MKNNHFNNTKNLKEQQKLNHHLQVCVNTLNDRQEIVLQELLQTRVFFKQQMDSFSATILSRIDAQNTATFTFGSSTPFDANMAANKRGFGDIDDEEDA